MENIELKQEKGDDETLYNLEAEQALLGSLLLNNSSLEQVSDFLRPFHFADGLHGQIFEAMVHLIDRGQVADPITLKDYFSKNDALQPVGGARYLVDLAQNVMSIIHVKDYGRLIYDLFLRRQLMSMGGHKYFKEALTEAIEMAEVAYRRDSHVVGVVGVTTGLIDLDKWLGGLQRSDLLIIAGRPSMGKTALATTIAFNAAVEALLKNKSGAPVAFFSLEMSAEQLATRILATESSVSSDKIRRGEIRAEDFPTFVDLSRRLSSVPLFIDDTPALSVSALRTRAQRIKQEEGLGLIIIDCLQMIKPDHKSNRSERNSDIVRSLKELAKELNVPVILLSQLYRSVEDRFDKRPQLSDFREDSVIEYADVVMFVYREEYYEVRREPPEGTDKHTEWQARMNQVHNQAEVIIAKHRNGPVGTVRLWFDSALTRFGNLLPI